MFVCDQPQTEVWQPNFANSGQSSPVWTRVMCHGLQIANSLEWAEWTDNPVQVILCDACGHDGCASGGYVHVSRLDRYVLWSAPQVGGAQIADENYEIPRFLRTLGTLALPVETWNEWSAAIREVPPAERLPEANHAAIADAWILGPGRSTATIIPYLRDHMIGGDTLEKQSAIALVERILELLQVNARASFRHPLVQAEVARARIETLYFDGPSELDWPALAFAGSDTYIALNRQRLVRIGI
jgi:hypothetical protein